jgi:hypothetical protein
VLIRNSFVCCLKQNMGQSNWEADKMYVHCEFVFVLGFCSCRFSCLKL